MEKTNLDQFVKTYISAWTTIDAAARKKLIAQSYSSDAKFFADEPNDEPVQHFGLQAIFENITQVNQRLSIENGLATECLDYAGNHQALRVRWQMKGPDGGIALKGMNLLLRNAEGKIISDYIFIG